MICDVAAPSWSWHPFATQRDLAPSDADAEFVAGFWQWADTYRGGEPVRLLMPPGPVDDWDGSVVRRPGSTEVGVEFLDADRPDQRTDLTLRLELTRRPDGTVRAVLEELHVM